MSLYLQDPSGTVTRAADIFHVGMWGGHLLGIRWGEAIVGCGEASCAEERPPQECLLRNGGQGKTIADVQDQGDVASDGLSVSSSSSQSISRMFAAGRIPLSNFSSISV